jgi:hypothetical protein
MASTIVDWPCMPLLAARGCRWPRLSAVGGAGDVGEPGAIGGGFSARLPNHPNR